MLAIQSPPPVEGPPPLSTDAVLGMESERYAERFFLEEVAESRARAEPSSRGEEQRVLRLAVLIADAAGEILYWNAEAQEALAALPGGLATSRIEDVFPAPAIQRLRAGRNWATLSPVRGPHLTWTVRARYLIDSGRSLYLFFERGAAC